MHMGPPTPAPGRGILAGGDFPTRTSPDRLRVCLHHDGVPPRLVFFFFFPRGQLLRREVIQTFF